MNTNGKPRAEINLARFQENYRRIPWEMLAPYAGQWVAISGDGTHVLASGPDLDTAEANLAALGVDGDAVGWDRIPGLNEESWM